MCTFQHHLYPALLTFSVFHYALCSKSSYAANSYLELAAISYQENSLRRDKWDFIVIFRIWSSPQSWNETPYFWVLSGIPQQKEAPSGSSFQRNSAHLGTLWAVFTRTALWEAQPCQHSWTLCVTFTAVMVMLHCCCQGMEHLSWKQGNHLGSQWGLGELDLWSKSRHIFTLFMISVPVCITCTIILWVWIFVLNRNEKLYSPREGLANTVNSILVFYGHLVLCLHQAGSRDRGNSSFWVKPRTFPWCWVVLTCCCASVHIVSRTVSSLTLVLLKAAGLLLTALTNPVSLLYSQSSITVRVRIKKWLQNQSVTWC